MISRHKPSILYKILCIGLIFALVNASTAQGIVSIVSSIANIALIFEQNGYDISPGAVNTGTNPLVDPVGRGGVWTTSDLDGQRTSDAILRGDTSPISPPDDDPGAWVDPMDNSIYDARPVYGPIRPSVLPMIVASHGPGCLGCAASGGGFTGTTSGGSTGSSGFTSGGSTGTTSTSGGTTGSSTTGTSTTSTSTTGASTTGASTTGSSATGGSFGTGTIDPGGGGSGPTYSHSGESYPWEGNGPGGGSSVAPGSVNTQTGNRMTSVPIVAWRGRGGMGINLTLFHNSQDSTDIGWGMNWRSSYDMSAVYLGTSTNSAGHPIETAVVTYPTGKKITFTRSLPYPGGSVAVNSVFLPPRGFYDRLTLRGNGWSLVTPSLTVYNITGRQFGYLSSIVDRNGNQTTISTVGSAKRITDAGGHYLDLTMSGLGGHNAVNASAYYTAATASDGRVWNFNYADSYASFPVPKYLMSVSCPSPVLYGPHPTVSFLYNNAACIVQETDRNSKHYNFTYDASSRLTSFKDPLNNQYTYTYNGGNTVLTNPQGGASVDYYSSGVLYTQKDEAGFSVTYVERDPDYNVTIFKDQRGNVSWAGYDSAGNTIFSQDPNQLQAGASVQLTYNQYSDLMTETTAQGATTNYTYVGGGNIATVTDATGRLLAANLYDAYGQLTSTTAGAATTYVNYNSYGLVTSIVTPDGTTTIGTYTLTDHPNSVTDAQGRTSNFVYDGLGRVSSVSRSDGSSVSVIRDAMNRTLSVSDWLSRVTSFTYDDAGRRLTKTNARNVVEQYSYDTLNRVQNIVDGNNHARTYTYTARGEVSYLQLPDAMQEHYVYDEAGNQTGRVNAQGQRTTYVYDAVGNLTVISYPSGPGVTFAYDMDSRQTSMVDANGTTSWTFDAADRETAVYQPQGSVQYTYDAYGRRTQLAEGTASSINYNYTAHRLTSIVKQPENETTSFSYDGYGRLSRQTNSNATYTDYGYDALDRVNDIFHHTPSGGTLSHEAYNYDAAGNLSYKTVDGIQTTYQYDNIDQLTVESKPGYEAHYGYDGNGNRTYKQLNGAVESYTYDAGDKLLSTAIDSTTTRSYSYDSNGRPTAISTPGGTTTLSYDFEDRITGINGPGFYQTNAYNGLDTRVGKTANGIGHTFKRTDAHVTAPLLSDSNGGALTTFVPGISTKSGGTTKVQHADRLGTNRFHTDPSATTVGIQDYDAFGALTSSTGTKNNLGFAGDYGYQEDDETGLKLLGHRLYDPSVGRFLTRDPIGSGLNWYAYCENCPLSLVDPTGNLGTSLDGAPGTLEASEMPEEIEGARKGMAAWKRLTNPFNYVKSAIAKFVRCLFSRAPQAVKAVAKRVPNPGGRHGGQLHREVVKSVAQSLQRCGNQIVSGGGYPETGFRSLVNGALRYPDIVYRTPAGALIAVNVGRACQDGTPIAREFRAIMDLLDSGKFDRVDWVPINFPMITSNGAFSATTIFGTK